eukprot:scaffold7887_cov286-Pinguiococcus_pyrenoidosus.AAC.3
MQYKHATYKVGCRGIDVEHRPADDASRDEGGAAEAPLAEASERVLRKRQRCVRRDASAGTNDASLHKRVSHLGALVVVEEVSDRVHEGEEEDGRGDELVELDVLLQRHVARHRIRKVLGEEVPGPAELREAGADVVQLPEQAPHDRQEDQGAVEVQRIAGRLGNRCPVGQRAELDNIPVILAFLDVWREGLVGLSAETAARRSHLGQRIAIAEVQGAVLQAILLVLDCVEPDAEGGAPDEDVDDEVDGDPHDRTELILIPKLLAVRPGLEQPQEGRPGAELGILGRSVLAERSGTALCVKQAS